MRELAKVVKVTRKRAEQMKRGPMAVHVVLVIDSATGQNGLNQALEFNDALGLDGIIMTKLDGTAKGGVVIGISDQFNIPVKYIGLGEGMTDLQIFRKEEFVRSLFGKE